MFLYPRQRLRKLATKQKRLEFALVSLNSDFYSTKRMDELTDYTSTVVEFRASLPTEKQNQLVDNCTGTDPLPPSKDISVETTRKCHVETQTQTNISSSTDIQVDHLKLASWLRRIYPAVEAELLKGPTPIGDNNIHNPNSSLAEDETQHIQTYQKILVDALENSQGLATWLSVHTNNAPVLVVSTCGPHDDWCEHLNQSLRVFMPQRMPSGNLVFFAEVKSLPVKTCLKSLSTNPFNKSVFAGSTLDGDIYIWQYDNGRGSGRSSNIEIKELFSVTATHGFAVVLDWAGENHLLACHANGWITKWLIGKQMLQECEYLIKPAPNTTTIIENSAMVCLGLNEFMVGTQAGEVFHCRSDSVGSVKKQLEITSFRRHRFMVSTLLKTRMAGHMVVISCDLSGQVYYHDIRNSDDDTANVILQIPLPFKNALACSRDANVIYCPGIDGSLECYRISNCNHSVIKGALCGKGNLIKCSDNGCWIITGLYGNEFQIFYIEN